MVFNWNEILETIYRALVSLAALFLVTKLIGKKQVSQLSLFDYVIGISIGNFGAEMTINLDSNELHGVVAVLVFGLSAYLVSFLTMKSIVLRKFFSGCPTILIQNGKIIKDGLKKSRFDINDLLEVCRCKGYFDIDDIEFAIMEANGEISMLPKTRSRNVQIEDMNLKVTKESLVANVVIDKKYMLESLKSMGKDEHWLNKELKKQNVKKDDILLATLDTDDNLRIYKQDFDERIKNILE